MNRQWLRLTIWFGLTVLAVSGGFVLAGHLLEWPDRTSDTISPQSAPPFPSGSSHQDNVTLHSVGTWVSYRLQAVYALTSLIAIAIVALVLSRRSIRPLVEIQRQLELVATPNLGKKIWVDTDDPQIQALVDHINALLSRMNVAFLNLQQFSAQVAHEIRTPLTVMRLKLEHAAERIEPQLAEEIQAELLRLTLHVEQALLIARAEQGQVQLARRRFDLEPMLQEVAGDFRLLAQEDSRDVVVISHPTFVDADPNHVRQILHNLFANATKHGRGTIKVKLRQSPDQVRLLIANKTDHSEIEEVNLGFGKRMVAALVALHGNMELHFRSKEQYHVVQLLFNSEDHQKDSSITAPSESGSL